MQAERCIFGRPTRSETMAERKTRVAILFGGRSAEHDVSRASAADVLRSPHPARYDVTPIGIGAVALAIPDDGPQLTLLPGGHGRALALERNTAGFRELSAFDLFFPVLH